MARKGETLSAETRAKITGRPRSANASPASIHQGLRKDHPVTGRCDECGREGRTDLAFMYHPASYTRNREDYRELCRSCHFKIDEPVVNRGRDLNASKTRQQHQAAGRKGGFALAVKRRQSQMRGAD